MKRIELRTAHMADASAAADVRHAIASLFNYQSFAAAGAAIKAASSALARYTNAIKALVAGRLVTKAAGDFPAINGDAVAAGASQMWIFTIDLAGNLATWPGQPNGVASRVKAPVLPDSVTAVAVLYLTNGAATAFTPGTTALDAASVTTTYVDLIGPFFPIL